MKELITADGRRLADHREQWPWYSRLPPIAALKTAPGTARGHVRTALKSWGLDEEISEVARLVVSELVTNGVTASTDPKGNPLYAAGHILMITVEVQAGPTSVRLDVWDQAPGEPVAHPMADAEAVSGRGLAMVGRLTGQRWGWHHHPERPDWKCVFAEIGVSEPAEQPS